MPTLANPRAERFCLEYVRSGDAGLAVVRSGLGLPTDPADGAAALKAPAIQARIEELRAPIEGKILSAIERKVKLSEIASFEPMPEAINANARITAIAELNKMDHVYEQSTTTVAPQIINIIVNSDKGKELIQRVGERLIAKPEDN